MFFSQNSWRFIQAKFFKRSYLRSFIQAKLLKARQLENFLPVNFPNKLENRRSPPKTFFRKGTLKICSKFTEEHATLLALQLYWNHTLAWTFSRKFAAYIQNTFLQEHLWRIASGKIHLNSQKIKTVVSLLFGNFAIN